MRIIASDFVGRAVEGDFDVSPAEDVEHAVFDGCATIR